jgi:hypothetical protein
VQLLATLLVYLHGDKHNKPGRTAPYGKTKENATMGLIKLFIDLIVGFFGLVVGLIGGIIGLVFGIIGSAIGLVVAVIGLVLLAPLVLIFLAIIL